MKYSYLPSVIYENRKKYFLISREVKDAPFDLNLTGWWRCEYSESKNGVKFPAEATDGGSIYYLISVEDSRKKAEQSLLEKLNDAKEILTEKRKEEIMKKWKDKMKKLKKK